MSFVPAQNFSTRSKPLYDAETERIDVIMYKIYFAESGSQTLRIQPREDGLSIDQIVLSPAAYLSSSPGAPKNDATVLSKSP